jgi:hypothetical protein
MIEENVQNLTANQKKALRVRNLLGHIESNLNTLEQPQIRFETNGKFERFLSLSRRTKNAC